MAQDSITAALDRIIDPTSQQGLIASGRAVAQPIKHDTASVILDVTGLSGHVRIELEQAIKRALGDIPGVAAVRVAMTAQKRGRQLIAIGSGKGGVGKSTLSANLAVALHRAGRQVGLIDADIYGPSQPRLMGAEAAKPTAIEKQLQPVATAYGVPMLSMGQLVPAGKAIAWRGPMVGGALGQLIEADWGEADTLILDLPPGTGDVQLTMIQKYRPAGAVIVSTPQDLALLDARRAIDLFSQANVPIIGLVENMAGYACPKCGEISDPFGRGGAEAAAAELGLPFLGRVPLDIAIRTASDAGIPPAAGEGPEARAFVEIGGRLIDWMNRNGG